jgi:hypothetical protein
MIVSFNEMQGFYHESQAHLMIIVGKKKYSVILLCQKNSSHSNITKNNQQIYGITVQRTVHTPFC